MPIISVRVAAHQKDRYTAAALACDERNLSSWVASTLDKAAERADLPKALKQPTPPDQRLKRNRTFTASTFFTPAAANTRTTKPAAKRKPKRTARRRN